MDFNPDEALAAGWLRPNSLAARLLDRMSRFSLRQAKKVVALDRFMRDRIIAKGIPPDKVVVIPPWSHDTEVKFDAEGREQFRKAHGLDGKFVVMYSGNHSPCHPLATLLAAAARLAPDPGMVFCFIGGGSEFRKIQRLVAGQRTAPNILCLPYQPLDQLAASLSAADLHVVVMGSAFVGLVHPCKIYNILKVAAPVLYIGPRPSHLSELLDALHPEYPRSSAGHGEVDRVVEQIETLRRQSGLTNRLTPAPGRSLFSKEVLLPRLIGALESA
jgi:hypothetical protein